MQNHAERIEDLNALEEVLEMMEQEIRNVRKQAEETQDYAPDAAKASIESLYVAQQNLDESRRRLNEARDQLNQFLELAQKARSTYDYAKQHSSTKANKEATITREAAEQAYFKLERKINTTRSKVQKTDAKIQKAQSKVKIAKIKAESLKKKEKNEKVRINMTLPEYMRDEWKDLSEDLSTSVSQMIREAMTLYTSELKQAGGNFERGLTKFGAKMEKVGKQVEDYVQNNIEKKYDPVTGELVSLKVKGREVLDKETLKNLKVNIPDFSVPTPVPTPIVPPIHPMEPSIDKEHMKKRVTGLIRIQKALPIDKLAQALDITEDDAENIIYELAAEGVDGNLKNGVFKFSSDPEEIIKIIHRVIDELD